MSAPGKWEDLTARSLTGAVVAIVGLGALWSGGLALSVLAAAVTGLMIWELARMTAGDLGKRLSALLGLAAMAVVLVAVLNHASPYLLALMALPPIAVGLFARKDRGFILIYAGAVLLTGYGLVGFREGYGGAWVSWLVLLVVVTDIMGYFGGRMLGGPKFWAKVSPKKTWSGTVAGWVGAALVAAAFVVLAPAPLWLVPFSVLVAFASQLGDIAESAIKRRTGVKDSSNILPGHGGVLDRFDGLIGAVSLLVVWGFATGVPQIGG